MRNHTENLWNATTGSNLHCVWVRVQDDRGDRLVSIWTDPAAARCKFQAQETACGIDPAASPIAGRLENHLNCVLPFCG